MEEGLTVISCFDGIACGLEAFKRAGIKIKKYYAFEIDKYSMQIAKKNHPEIKYLGDINEWQDNLVEDKIDFVIGGPSCQAFSFAGKQLNFDDPRGQLFFKFVAVLNHYRPKYFLMENTPMKKEFLTVMTNVLSRIYSNTRITLLNSSEFSAQDRKRYYWTNFDIDDIEEPCKDTVEDILLDEVDDKYYIEPSRAVAVCDNEVNKRKIGYIGTDSQGNRIYRIHNKSVTLCGASGGLGAKTGLYALPCLTPTRTTKRQNGRRFKPPKSKFFTLTASDVHGVLVGHHIRKLHPIEAERLQTLQDNYTDCVSDNQRYKALGNGWTVNVITHIIKSALCMKWEKNVRSSGLIEWVCEHGVGHPDIASVKEMGNDCWGIHGCDGCCHRDDFPGKYLKH